MKLAELLEEKKHGLWDNIHAKRKRIKAGSGEKMRKPGSKGAPTNKDLKSASVDEGAAGVNVVQSKKVIKKLRDAGSIMPKGHMHKKGKDWEDTSVIGPNGKKVTEGYTGDWAILPATMELYGRRTVDIITAASEWDDEVILVCKNEQDRTCFVGSAGGESSFNHYKGAVGKSFSTHHDQTGASKGMYMVKNVVRIKKGEIVDKVNETGLKEKASLAVFK